jgi:ABC-type Zn2+ transport system substrate-binding protein/surface adhesin
MKRNASKGRLSKALPVLFIAMQLGCSGSNAPKQLESNLVSKSSHSAEHDEHEHDHEHEHQHEEHEHFPPHWPKSIFQASARLEQLIELADGRSLVDDRSSSRRVSVEQELVDLLNWLPELCADSDLSEEVFNDMDKWSAKHKQSIEDEIRTGKSLAQLLAGQELRDRIQSLGKISREEQERIKAMEQ